MNIHPAVTALFGEFKDAYTVLTQPDGAVTSSTSLDPNDTAIIICEDDTIQLFLPENGEMTDRALAIVEVYNAMCKDKAGVVNKKGKAIPENEPYQGFTAERADAMKARIK
jgi:hypothetical protein